MGEHLALCVDRLITPESLQSLQGSDSAGLSRVISGSQAIDPSASIIDIKDDETEPLIGTLECRICQEEDSVKNLEVPCACNGSLKYAHRTCVQRWCNEKGDIICEICNQPYQPGFTAPPRAPSQDSTMEIGERWRLGGAHMDLNEGQLLAMAAAERRLLEAEYDEYSDSSASGAAFCRSAALILMALLLLRHAVTLGNGEGEDDDDDVSAFSLFLLRAAGFLLPCYIMAWAISILQRRRQRQEASSMAAAEVAFLLQAGQTRGVQVTVAPVLPTPASPPPPPPPPSASLPPPPPPTQPLESALVAATHEAASTRRPDSSSTH